MTALALSESPALSESAASKCAGIAALEALMQKGDLDAVTREFLRYAYGAEKAARHEPSDAPLLLTTSEILPRLAQSCRDAGQAQLTPLTGFLVSLEGGDGSGKTTQTKALAAALDGVATRAIGGGGAGALALREIILNPDYTWHPVAEALMSMAIYREALARVIIPALAAGQVVVCDRLIDTALIYFRDECAGLSQATIQQLYDILVQDMAPGLMPQLTFLLDLPFEAAMRRRDVRTQGRMDRNEGKGEAFHRGVIDELRRLAHNNSRFYLLDAQCPAEEITASMLAEVNRRRVSCP